jgi:hypothetical protein
MGDWPLVGDVDGDGGDDLVIWRPADGLWYAKNSRNEVLFRRVQWGQMGDVPLLGEFGAGAIVERPAAADPPPRIITRPIAPPPDEPGEPAALGPIRTDLFTPGAWVDRCSSSDCSTTTDADIELDPEGMASLTFLWNTNATESAEGIYWQVSAEPFPSYAGGEASDLDPAALVDDGFSDGRTGTFSVSFRQAAEAAASKVPTDDGLVFHVRVLPVAPARTKTVAGPPSNVMRVYFGVDVPTAVPDFVMPTPEPITDPPTDPLFRVTIESFTPPVFENPNLWGCVVVTGNTLSPPVRDEFPVGKRICPDSYEGKGDQITSPGELVEWTAKTVTETITDTWDWAADKFGELKSLAVEFVLEYTVYGLQCKAAAMAAHELGGGDAEQTAKDICDKGAEIAVDAGLVALGVPPTMPSYNELVDRGVDYAVDLAKEEFESNTGIPCVEWCEDAMRAGMDEFAGELKRTKKAQGCVSEAAAHEYGKEPLCLPDGIDTKPAPGAIYQPPILSVTVTRRADIPDPRPDHPACDIDASMLVRNHFPGGRVTVSAGTGAATNSKDVPAQDIEGELFAGTPYAPLPLKMARGTSTQIQLVFNQRNRFILPWTTELFRGWQVEPGPSQAWRDWFTLYRGGTARLRVSSNCAEEGDTRTYGFPEL